jgi:hypothetical protein
MNQSSSTDSAVSLSSGSDAISRRAYELWENEGRPAGCDLRHWLQAEQELGSRRAGSGSSNPPYTSAPPKPASDVRPPQASRVAGAVTRESKRGSTTPFPGEKSRLENAIAQTAGKRKSPRTPPL